MSTTLSAPGDQLHIVNPDPKYPRATLIEPTSAGYLYVAARVHPSPIPLILPSAERSSLLVRLKELARVLERIDAVTKATVFRAIVEPPTARFSGYLRERDPSLRVASYDVMLLIQTTSPASTLEARNAPAFEALMDALHSNADEVFVMAARNVRRIADVPLDDAARSGLYLFNHFAAENPDVMPQLWDYLAGWYAVETGLDNSVALAPLEGEPSDYAVVNWARWDEHPALHFWHQLHKKSFWNYVTENLEANHAGSMPIYCRLA